MEDEIFNLGSLPEVVITPDKESNLTLQHLREIFPNKQYRRDFKTNPIFKSNQISDNQVIDRLYNVFELSDKPSVTYQPSITNLLFIDKYRANYNLISNRIYLPSKTNNQIKKRNKQLEQRGYQQLIRNKDPQYINHEDYIPELSHALQVKSNFINNPNIFELPSDIKINGKTGYNRKDHYEYEAHKIIEPLISKYIQGQLDLDAFKQAIRDKNSH